MASFGQINTSSGRQLNLTPQGWINNQGQNLNAAPGQLSDLAQPQDLSSFLEANGTSMKNLVDYNGKKAFRVPDGYVWQNPDGTTGKATIYNPMQEAYQARQAAQNTAAADAAWKAEQRNFERQKAPLELENLQARTEASRAERAKTLGETSAVPKLGEDQGKATTWVIQAQNAFENMQKAMKEEPGSATPGLPDAIAAIPSLGLGETVANTMRSAPRQKFIQGSQSLSEALLHAATGAGFSKEEAMLKAREVTPVFGEDATTTKQKMEAIPLFLEGLKVRAGPGAKRAEEIKNTAAQKRTSMDTQETLFNAKKAIAKNPAARQAIIQKMQAAGYDVKGL